MAPNPIDPSTIDWDREARVRRRTTRKPQKGPRIVAAVALVVVAGALAFVVFRGSPQDEVTREEAPRLAERPSPPLAQPEPPVEPVRPAEAPPDGRFLPSGWDALAAQQREPVERIMGALDETLRKARTLMEALTEGALGRIESGEASVEEVMDLLSLLVESQVIFERQPQVVSANEALARAVSVPEATLASVTAHYKVELLKVLSDGMAWRAKTGTLSSAARRHYDWNSLHRSLIDKFGEAAVRRSFGTR